MLINGRFLTRPPTGVDRFASELIRSIAQQRLAPIELVVPGAAAVRDTLADCIGGVRRAGRFGGHAWEQIELPAALGAEPLVGLCNTGPALRVRQMVVVHDAATFANPGNYSRTFRTWYRLMLTQLARRSRRLVTVSAFSADELMRHLGRRAAGIDVVGEGGEHILREPADRSLLQRLGLLERPYVLAVGSHSPNKNFGAVVRALESLDSLDLPLVAVGGGDERVFAGTSLPSDRVIRTGFVDDAQLRALYEHALCFVFPSYYEGFGLPPLEAMNCGCPVIATNRASLPEVCGEAVLYCDPDDPATIAEAIRRLHASPSLRNDLAEAGAARAAQHGWDRSARQFVDLYRESFE